MDTNGNTKELIKDLCSRLPYGIIVNVKGFDYDYNDKLTQIYRGVGCSIQVTTNVPYDIEQVKPYLFPLSSMTKEQKKGLENLGWNFDNFEIHNVSECLGTYREYVAHSDCFNLIDWLNKNHFDYRGLIEKGLAIDATGLNIY